MSDHGHSKNPNPPYTHTHTPPPFCCWPYYIVECIYLFACMSTCLSPFQFCERKGYKKGKENLKGQNLTPIDPGQVLD